MSGIEPISVTGTTILEKSTYDAVEKNILLNREKKIIDSAVDYIKDYKVLKKIGSGMYARIFLLEDINGVNFVLKVIEEDMYETKDYNMLETEIEIYKHFASKYGDQCQDLGLLCLKNVFQLSSDLGKIRYIILNYYGDSDLSIYLKNKNLNIYEKELIIFHLCKNLKLLHDNGISHKDIKPDNIRIDSDTKIVLDNLS